MSIERVPYRAGCVLILQSHDDTTWDVTVEIDGEPVGAPHAQWHSREGRSKGPQSSQMPSLHHGVLGTALVAKALSEPGGEVSTRGNC
jgi:hypothetical protein